MEKLIYQIVYFVLSFFRILRQYILLNVARSLKPYFDMITFQADIDPDVGKKSVWNVSIQTIEAAHCENKP